MDHTHILTLLRNYAGLQSTYKEISLMLKKNHGISLSANAIGKRLRASGMPRRRGDTIHTKNEVKDIIKTLLTDLPCSVGYRQMTAILKQKKVHVRRDTVMEILRELDPGAVAHRRKRRIQRKVYRSKGPNFVWHVDGYDKLKPYGFAIHGCIDGKILWLNVGSTNNNPAVVAYNYVNCVEELKGCPLVLQTDPGTENGIMCALQCLFRHNAIDCFAGKDSCRIVKSVFNQRIEAWWSMLRRLMSEWWISFFKDLESFGAFCKGNEHHQFCLRICFMPVLKHQLHSLVERWNNHYITRSRQAECPNGRPILLHSLPEEYGFTDNLCKVDKDDLLFGYSQCQMASISGSSEFDTYAGEYFQQRGWRPALTWKEALQQYLIMKEINNN